MLQRYRTAIILSAVFFVLLAGLYWYARANKAQAQSDIHFHAAFQVYADNTLVDFTDAKYMHISPCSEDEEAVSDDEEQIEKAHLHDNVGDVVHVHRKNAKWKDLFKNISYDIDGSVVGYINGERAFGVLNKHINADDRALFLLGEYQTLDAKLEALPTIDRIRTVEQSSEGC